MYIKILDEYLVFLENEINPATADFGAAKAV